MSIMDIGSVGFIVEVERIHETDKKYRIILKEITEMIKDQDTCMYLGGFLVQSGDIKTDSEFILFRYLRFSVQPHKSEIFKTWLESMFEGFNYRIWNYSKW